MHLYGAGGATRGTAGAHGSDASGSGTGSARPSGVFLRRVEEALFPALPTGIQGASSSSSSSASRSPDAHQAASRSSPRSPMGGIGMPEADARAASEAVVSMLGHVGRGASSGAGGPGSGLGGGRGGAGSGARRMAGLSSAVETLVSAFRLSKPRVRWEGTSLDSGSLSIVSAVWMSCHGWMEVFCCFFVTSRFFVLSNRFFVLSNRFQLSMRGRPCIEMSH